MKRKILIILLISTLMSCNNQKDFNINEPYFGQTAPGGKPELFAPNIISKAYDERMIFFCNEGNECYFQMRGVPHTVIFHIKNSKEGWGKPETAFFSGKYFEEFGISQDGNTIVFTSNRPLHNQELPQKDFYVWKSQKINGDWMESEWLGEIFKGAGYPTISNNGNIYFFDEREDGIGKGDIYVSEFINGRYQTAKNLGDSVNTENYDVDPFIAPDESYLIFTSHKAKIGLYISYKLKDGTWTKSIYMGDEIGKGESICPSVSSDGKYLFFTSMRNSYVNYKKKISYDEKLRILNGPGNGSNDIYWVDASIIEKLKPNYIK